MHFDLSHGLLIATSIDRVCRIKDFCMSLKTVKAKLLVAESLYSKNYVPNLLLGIPFSTYCSCKNNENLVCYTL